MSQKSVRVFLALTATIACSMSFLSCNSYDLGDEAPDSIAVDAANPTWDNGVGQVFATKCANCHSTSRDQFVPTNTPATFNSVAAESFFTEPGNKGKIHLIQGRVFETPEEPMPPKFATPLTEEEKQAIAVYMIGITNLDAVCSTPETALTYDDVEPVIAASCALSGCHAAGTAGRQSLSTLESMRANRMASAAYINGDYMPFGAGAQFKATDNGKKLLEWLCAGADVK